VLEAVERIRAELANRFRVKVDAREGYTPGWKFNEWELRGVPLRIEIGPRDVAQESVMLARRDVAGKAGKSAASMAGLADTVGKLLDTIQAGMLANAAAFMEANIHEARTYDELKEIVADGWARAYWCGDDACEAKIKEETKASNRNIPLDQGDAGPGRCVVCGQPAEEWAYWARAY
jgi:prolyl-tRNA synthetase